MAKFYGVIGYADTVEVSPGYWEDTIIERKYSGDLFRTNKRRETSSNGVIDNITISNEISILADPYATEHFYNIKYVKFLMPKLGGAWIVSDVGVNYPRLTLTIGGVYNGPTAQTPDNA